MMDLLVARRNLRSVVALLMLGGMYGIPIQGMSQGASLINFNPLIDSTGAESLDDPSSEPAIIDILGQIGGPFVRVPEVESGVAVDPKPANSSSGASAVRKITAIEARASEYRVRLVVRSTSETGAYALEERLSDEVSLVQVDEPGGFDSIQNAVKWGPFFEGGEKVLHYVVSVSEGGALEGAIQGVFSLDGSSIEIEEEPTFLIHPADLDLNSRVELDEMTAYGAAWKRAEHWAMEPNPIPIDYVTWAGVLWKKGEVYYFDSNVGEGPRWWASQSPTTEGPSGLTRQSISEWITLENSNARGSLSVRVFPPRSVSTWAIELSLFDSSEVLRFGPFHSRESREIEIPASVTTSIARARGSFDGRSLFRSFEQPRLTSVTFRGESEVLLFGDGISSDLLIEVSSDLKHWEPVDWVPSNNGGVVVKRSQGAAVFYRIGRNR